MKNYVISFTIQQWREDHKENEDHTGYITFYQLESDDYDFWRENLPDTEEIEEKFVESILEKQDKNLKIPDFAYESEVCMTSEYYNKIYEGSMKILSSYSLEKLKEIFKELENKFRDFNIDIEE